MPKFIEQILEMRELNEEFMEFEFPDFSDEEPDWHKSEAEIEEDGHVW